MLQFLPALILLLLQSQGYANRSGTDRISAQLVSVSYRQTLAQPANRAVRDVQRALLVKLLETNSSNPDLSGQILSLLRAIDEPVRSSRGVVSEDGEVAEAIPWPPDNLSSPIPVRSAQRFRDGPLSNA